MNDFPVIGELVMRKGLWDRQGAKIASQQRNVWRGAVYLLKAVSLDRECHVLP